MDLTACWSLLGEVDITPLLAWLASGKPGWPPVKGMQPNRLRVPPEADPVIAAVLAFFPEVAGSDRHTACLSRLIPGATYEMHRDNRPPGGITLVHVPLVTSPGAWHRFKEEPEPFHMEAGKAYSFDARRPHNYGNDSPADRVHLIFDVLAG